LGTDVELEQRPLRDAVRKFLDHHASSERVHEIASGTPTLDRTFWKAASELGWTSLLVPEALGGGSVSGHPFADVGVLAQESGRHIAPGPLSSANSVAFVLAHDAGHADTLAAVLDGSAVAAFALSDGGGWEPSDVTARAEQTPDGYAITGVKHFVEGAPDADVFLVIARAPEGLAQFVIEKSAPGLTVTPKRSLDPMRTFGTVEFVSTPVNAQARVRGELAEDALAELAFCTAITIQVAETAAMMRCVFEMTIEWVSQRYAFGRVIGSYQALKHRLAEHFLAVECAAGVSTGLAEAMDSRATNAAELASTAKAYVGDSSVSLVSDAIQMHGGIGMTWEHDLHLYLRRVSTNRVIYGSPSEHRERLCKLAGL
jgi:alkylation response protein AidB-like acyl-CoA dehydrogenase